MEDQGELRPQTFLVDNFSFNRGENKTIKWVLNAHRGFKSAAWTLQTLENQNGNVQYKFEVEFSF